ncbi:MAG: Rieske (2Fe-2S) protein [Flavobacteriales bacterium]
MFTRKIRWHKLADSFGQLYERVPPNKPLALSVAGKNLIVCRHEEKLSVLIDKCPHMGYRLYQGRCENGKIICPYHRYAFSLEDGMGPGLGLDTFPLEERENGLYVGISYFSIF